MRASLKDFVWLVVMAASIGVPAHSFSQETIPTPPVYVDTDFPLPQSLSLCGEAVPLGSPWVRDMLDRELTISAWNKDQGFMWLKRAGRYFPYIEERLRQEGMPQDIKYLAIAESGLVSRIRSNKGAAGFWQFIEDTGVRYGLRNDDLVDERRDLEASTEAALTYLKTLKGMFGSWTLAMAAYNCGERRVERSIAEQRQRDYYTLDLPEETERYIFRIAAAKLIMENPEKYGYLVPKEKIYAPIPCDTVQVAIQRQIHITDFAEGLGTTYKLIRDMNPKLMNSYLPLGVYSLSVPPGKGGMVPSVISTLSESAAPSSSAASSRKSYVVKAGDTLSEISDKTGVPVSRLKALNHLRDGGVQVGQALSLE